MTDANPKFIKLTSDSKADLRVDLAWSNSKNSTEHVGKPCFMELTIFQKESWLFSHNKDLRFAEAVWSTDCK